MGILDYFRASRPSSASVAKERLQIIVAHERGLQNRPSYLPLLEKEILQVVRKYVEIQQDDVKVNLERDGNCEVLELNVVLPDSRRARAQGVPARP